MDGGDIKYITKDHLQEALELEVQGNYKFLLRVFKLYGMIGFWRDPISEPPIDLSAIVSILYLTTLNTSG